MQRLATRRHILIRLGALAAGGLGLSACLRQPAPAAPPTSAPVGVNAQSAPAVLSAPTTAPAAPTSAAAAPAATGQPKRGGQITVGVQGDWVTMDPPNNNADI